MSAMRSSPAGQARLVDHALEALDVVAGVLVERGRGVETLAQGARLLGQLAEVGHLDVEVPSDGPKELARTPPGTRPIT